MLFTDIAHTGYPEKTNATDNNKHSWNQQAGIGCKYLSANNLPRIQTDPWQVVPRQVCTPYDCILISVTVVVLCRVGCLWVAGVMFIITKMATLMLKLVK